MCSHSHYPKSFLQNQTKLQVHLANSCHCWSQCPTDTRPSALHKVGMGVISSFQNGSKTEKRLRENDIQNILIAKILQLSQGRHSDVRKCFLQNSLFVVIPVGRLNIQKLQCMKQNLFLLYSNADLVILEQLCKPIISSQVGLLKYSAYKAMFLSITILSLKITFAQLSLFIPCQTRV